MARKKKEVIDTSIEKKKEKVEKKDDKPKKIICVVGPQEEKEKFKDEEKKPEQLFDFLNNMFADKKGFLEKTMYERGKFAFMTTRFMSIKMPTFACAMSKIGINTGAAVTCFFYLTQNIFRTPQWMYISTKKAKEEKKKEFDVDDELIKYYCKIHEIDMKTFNEAKELYPEDLLKEVKEFGKSYMKK